MADSRNVVTAVRLMGHVWFLRDGAKFREMMEKRTESDPEFQVSVTRANESRAHRSTDSINCTGWTSDICLVLRGTKAKVPGEVPAVCINREISEETVGK